MAEPSRVESECFGLTRDDNLPAYPSTRNLAQEIDKICDAHYKSMTKSSGRPIIDLAEILKNPRHQILLTLSCYFGSLKARGNASHLDNSLALNTQDVFLQPKP